MMCKKYMKYRGFTKFVLSHRRSLVGIQEEANSIRENSLFDTEKMSRSFFGPEIFFVPYLTLTLTFIPNMTLPSDPLASSVREPGTRCQIF